MSGADVTAEYRTVLHADIRIGTRLNLRPCKGGKLPETSGQLVVSRQQSAKLSLSGGEGQGSAGLYHPAVIQRCRLKILRPLCLQRAGIGQPLRGDAGVSVCGDQPVIGQIPGVQLEIFPRRQLALPLAAITGGSMNIACRRYQRGIA